MENNFFVGDVIHSRRFGKQEYIEKCVLYSDDNFNYLDLVNGKWYSTDCSEKDYVLKETINSTDVSLYRENYQYLLNKFGSKKSKMRTYN